MSGLTRSILVECPREQSDEYIARNNQNPAQWTNRCGDGIHIKAGDTISVHSSFISEIGAEAGQIQISGKSLGRSVDVSITQYNNKLFNDSLPNKYSLVEVENASQSIDIRDDTLNLVVSPYKSALISHADGLETEQDLCGIRFSPETEVPPFLVLMEVRHGILHTH